MIKISNSSPLAALAEVVGVTEEELKGADRSRRLSDARAMTAAALKQLPDMRQTDIAEVFGMSQAAVSKMLRRHRDLIAVDAVYRQRWEGLFTKGINKLKTDNYERVVI